MNEATAQASLEPPREAFDTRRRPAAEALGTALLLAVVKSDTTLPTTRALLLSILRATPMDIADLGSCESSSGPARWAALTAPGRVSKACPSAASIGETG